MYKSPHASRPRGPARVPRVGAPLRAGLLALVATSCGVLRKAAEAPAKVAEAVMPGLRESAPPLEQQYQDLTRVLERMLVRVDAASRALAAQAGSDEARLAAARLRLAAVRWATRFASGPNALNGALDLVVLAAAVHARQESHWIPDVWGEAARPLADAFAAIEGDGWELLGTYLDDADVARARDVLARWLEEGPALADEPFADSPSFRALAEGRPSEEEDAPGLLGLLQLDPLADIEPARREIERSRQLGQRVLFFLRQAPRLVAAEAEVGLLRVQGSDGVRRALDDADRLTASLESFAATARDLPEAVRAEREALVADLGRVEEPLARLLEESRGALDAGRASAAEVRAAVGALDGFVARLDARDAQEPAGTPARPFDVREYESAARAIGEGAARLEALLAELDRELPALRRALDETAARGERAIDRAALRLLQVGLALVLAAALAAALVRRGGPRREPASREREARARAG